MKLGKKRQVVGTAWAKALRHDKVAARRERTDEPRASSRRGQVGATRWFMHNPLRWVLIFFWLCTWKLRLQGVVISPGLPS